MRFRNLLIVTLLILVQAATAGSVLLTLSGFLTPAVQIVTILALLFPVYAVWRQNLQRNRKLIDGVRIWANHWDLMSRQFLDPVKMDPRAVTGNDVKNICDLANSTADHLAEALARGARLIKDTKPIIDLISDWRAFSRNPALSGNNELFITEILRLRPRAEAAAKVANDVFAKYSTRYGMPQKYYEILTSNRASWVAWGLLVISTALWAWIVLPPAATVVLRLLGH